MKIQKTVCVDMLQKMRKVEQEVQAMAQQDELQLLSESSGKSCESLKTMIQEMHGLKADIYEGMFALTNSIADYVSDHVELDEESAKRIQSSLK